MMMVLRAIFVTVLAASAFYGIYRLAKWRGVFDK